MWWGVDHRGSGNHRGKVWATVGHSLMRGGGGGGGGRKEEGVR